MQQTEISFDQRAHFPALLSLTRPNKELFQRHRAMLRRAIPVGSPASSEAIDCRPGFDDRMIQHNDSTFFMRVTGNSMTGLGILDGDLLVVDRSMPATSGSIVIAVVDGEFTVRQLQYTAEGSVLRTAHPSGPDMAIGPGQDVSIWGVVQWNVRKNSH